MTRFPKITLAAALALGVALPATGVVAQPTGEAAPRLPAFAELDMNGDGQLTVDEFTAHRTARLQAQDADGDGLLSAQELAAAAQTRMQDRAARRAERMVSRLDADGDGLLSLEEIADARGRSPERMLNRLDKDGDGSLSAEEFAAVQERMERKGDRGHDHGHGPRGFWRG